MAPRRRRPCSRTRTAPRLVMHRPASCRFVASTRPATTLAPLIAQQRRRALTRLLAVWRTTRTKDNTHAGAAPHATALAPPPRANPPQVALPALLVGSWWLGTRPWCRPIKHWLRTRQHHQAPTRTALLHEPLLARARRVELCMHTTARRKSGGRLPSARRAHGAAPPAPSLRDLGIAPRVARFISMVVF